MTGLLHHPDDFIKWNKVMPVGHPGINGCIYGISCVDFIKSWQNYWIAFSFLPHQSILLIINSLS